MTRIGGNVKASHLLKQRQQQHAFRGEMRVRINRRVYPNPTPALVEELTKQVLQGEKIEGVEVLIFKSRNANRTAQLENRTYTLDSFLTDALRAKAQRTKAKNRTRERGNQ